MSKSKSVLLKAGIAFAVLTSLSPAQAQSDREAVCVLLAKKPDKVKATVTIDYDYCTQALSSDLERLDSGAPTIKTTAISNLRVLGQTNGTMVKSLSERRMALVSAHVAYKKMKQRAKHDKVQAATLAALTKVGEEIHRQLKDVDLDAPLAAVFDTGIAVTDTGTSASLRAATSGDIKGDAANFIRWSSKHFRDEQSHLDYSFGGRIGYGPSLAVFNCSSCATNPLRHLHQQSFIWDLDGRANLQVSNIGEISPFVKFGQSRLTEKETKVTDGANSVVAGLANNGTAQTASFYEFGLEFKYYQKNLTATHHDRSFLSPAFGVHLALRDDSRFRKGVDLAALTSPQRRLVFGMAVNLPKFLNDPNSSDPDKALSFSFAVEHERGFGSNPLPSGTRLYFMGKLNLPAILKKKE